MLVAVRDRTKSLSKFCLSLRLPGDRHRLVPVPVVGGAVVGLCLLPPVPINQNKGY